MKGTRYSARERMKTEFAMKRTPLNNLMTQLRHMNRFLSANRRAVKEAMGEKE